MTDQEDEMEMASVTETEGSMDEGHAGTWQEEAPPEDDFHDQDQVTQTSSEEEGAEEPVYDTGEGAEEKKKKSPLVVLGVLAVLLAGLGGLIYTQLGSGDPLSEFEAMPAPAQVVAQPKPPISETPATPKTAEADLAALSEASRQAAANQGVAQPVPPAPAPSVVPAAPSPVPAPLGAPSAAPVATATPVVPTPVVPPAASVVPAPAAQVAMPSIVEPGKDIEKRLNAMESKMNDLQKSLENIGIQTAELASLFDKNKAALETKRASKKTSPAPVVQPAPVEPQEAMTEEKPVASNGVAEEEAAKPKATVKKKAVSPKKAKAAKAEKASNSSAKWVLRAATPEGAWLSQGANAAELRKVEVGETVPGLGKIKAIREKNGVWEVVGTKGSSH